MQAPFTQHPHISTAPEAAITIRAITPTDWPQWAELYRAYAAFYDAPMSDEILARTWSWLLADEHPQEALVAQLANGSLVGLAHFRPFPKPMLGQDAGFLDDLFVAPALRGQGIGRGLIAAVASVAQARGWPLVRWITAPDNAQARQLYDGLAQATSWLTYDLKTG